MPHSQLQRLSWFHKCRQSKRAARSHRTNDQLGKGQLKERIIESCLVEMTDQRV
jgi:hypothetical protein